jgi:predicted transcriptional regulator
MSAAPRKNYDTKLDRWMVEHDIKPAHLAVHAEYSRQHLLRIRKGEMEPTRRCIKAVVSACRRLSRTRVKASDLFDLGD